MRWAIGCAQCKKVAPQKTAETDAIFAQLEQLRQQYHADKTVLRLSLDAKATVLIGDYSRGGKNRLVVKAAEHDFQPSARLTPYGILLPDHARVFLYFTPGRVTSDFIVDCLRDCWAQVAPAFPEVQTLVLLQDNGPENHSRRTPFMRRITQLADHLQLTVHLLYYPPYHSKYNPIERVWGCLEQHWNGDLLDSVTTVLNFAQTMTWHKQPPVVTSVHQLYATGVRLSQKARALLEQRLERLHGLAKYFVLIRPLPLALSG
ncbi:MAG: transposase [Caldilineaceae bacterium]